jgi:hypothetical protein
LNIIHNKKELKKMAMQDKQKLTWMEEAKNMAERFQTLRRDAQNAMQKWSARSYSSAETGMKPADFTGTDFDGMAANDISGLTTTLNAFEVWIDGGHDDNLSKITD